MQLQRRCFGPLGAFGFALALAALYYLGLALWVREGTHILAHPLNGMTLAWLPVALCGLGYWITVDDSSSRPVRIVRTAVASTLAPLLVFSCLLLVGLMFFDWRM